MTNSAPTAAGSLEKSPVLHLLVSGVDHRTTGTLVLETEDGQRSALLLHEGIPVKFKAASPVERLGSVLVSLGWLEESACEHTFKEAAANGKLHGQYLIETGTLDADVVERGLRTQMLRKLLWANRLAPTTVYGLYENQDFLSRWAGMGTPVSPLRAIWCLASNSADSVFCSRIIARLATQVLRIRPDAVIEKFGFESGERALLDVLKAKPQSIGELTKLGILPVPVIHALVYVLTLTRQLDLGSTASPLGVAMQLDRIYPILNQRAESSRPVVIGARPNAATTSNSVSVQVDAKPQEASSKSDPEILDKRQRILELAELEANLDHYKLLGLGREADSENIQQAFFTMAKLLHPDRLGPELADLKEVASRIFGRLVQAQQCLTDAVSRREYDIQLAGGRSDSDREQERVQAVIQAATSYQKAEVLLKKRMFAAAELEAQHAHENDSDQADYLALLAWIRANKPDAENHLLQILDQLNEALRMDPGSEKTHFYRAQVLSRLGRQREALADYRFVVTKNPHHIDALREIRIWEMRRKDRDTLPGAGGASGRTNPPAPGPSRHPSDPKHPARTSNTPAPQTSKPGVLSKLFKR